MLQLSLLLTNTVLFVGLSLTDPNTRRILDVVRSLGSSHEHYAILKDPSLERRKQQEGSWFPSYGAKLTVFTDTLRDRGINAIWVESYDELPDILENIKKG